MKLKDTVVMMNSPNYQDRFRAEYWQNEIRLEKLLNLIDKYRRNALDFEPNCDLTILQAQAKWYGKQVVKIDRFYPSSQICSECGSQWPGTKDLAVRSWICPECGAAHDRDFNAAKNILNEGLRLMA